MAREVKRLDIAKIFEAFLLGAMRWPAIDKSGTGSQLFAIYSICDFYSNPLSTFTGNSFNFGSQFSWYYSLVKAICTLILPCMLLDP